MTRAATLAAEVRAEATLAAQQRRAANAFTAAQYSALTPGGRVEALAYEDDPNAAIQRLRRQWPDLWQRICAHAAADNCRPTTTLVELIAEALDRRDAEAVQTN